MDKILICTGTSGIAAYAVEVACLFEELIKKHKLDEQYRVVRVGDRGLFRDVLVDVVTEDSRLVYEFVKPENVEQIVIEHLVGGRPVEKLLAGKDYEDFFSGQMRIVLSNCGEIDPEDIGEYIARGGYEALKTAVSMESLDIIETVTSAGLRGRGGGGFPTGLKWKFCFEAQGDEKYVVCNADEGDPGAFMDRSVLEGDPHSVIEGMAIAGRAIGAASGVIYCRAEYPLAVKRLQCAIDDAGARGFLGDNIMGTGFSFDIEIMQGAGAFVCGEETALIASIEGKRGLPRPRPPFPAVKGLWDKPTNINNVETFANVRHIIAKGADWYSSIGTDGSKGTKVFALAGKVKNTGLVEVPMGTTIKDLVFGLGGGMARKMVKFKAVQLGGPSGGCLPESLADMSIDYESITGTGAIMGSGGMIIMDQQTCMVDVARYFLEFTVEESCGQCTPCRVGLRRMLDVLIEITDGRGKPKHMTFLKEMGETVKSMSLCGLGQTAPNPALTTMRYFQDEYDLHVNKKECPAHVCPELLKFKVIEDKCAKCGMCQKTCPVDAIEWKKGEVARIDLEKCTECRSCIRACPFMAIE